MSVVGSLLKFAFGLIALEWRQRRKRPEPPKPSVYADEPQKPQLRVVQGGRR